MSLGPQPNLESLLTVLDERIGRIPVVTTRPDLGDMEVGELWAGDGTESSPAAGSNAIYIKVDSATIMVVRTNGTSIEGAHIT
jgi:hypothetical protein